MTDFWTADRIETLRVMHHKGHTSREIGMVIGATRNQVIGKLHRLGIVTQSTANEWTEERVETLRRMYMDGAIYAEISEATGFGIASCQQKASRMGLPRRGTDTFRRPTKPIANKPRAWRPKVIEGMQAPSLELATDIVNVTGCKWPVTPDDVEKGGHLFCNHATEVNEKTGNQRPYCPYHSELNRAKAQPKAEVKRFVIPTSLLRVVA